MTIDSSTDLTILVYTITEAVTFLPSFYFGLIRDNGWFRLAVEESNFRGQGQKLYLAYANIDARHNFNIAYRVPFLRSSKLGFSFGMSKYSSVEPLYFQEQVFFDYVNWSAVGSMIYNINERHYLEGLINSFRESFDKSDRHKHEMTEGPEYLKESKALMALIQRLTKIDYSSFYLEGWDIKNTLQVVRNLDAANWFRIGISESRFFYRVGAFGNVAARLRLGISDNTASPFAPFVLDSYFNIRGVGNRIDRGTATVTLNLEYRQTLLDWRWLAVQVVGFSDIGTWRTPGGDFSDFTDRDVLKHFVGGGLRLIYKYAFDRMVRLDYGLDLYDRRQRGWVIGVGQYF